jgi:hypothetical protein
MATREQESHIRALNACFETFTKDLPASSVAEKLRITPEFVAQIRKNGFNPSRKTVLKNEWAKILPQLHPAARKGKPVPDEDMRKLQEYLTLIIGPSPLAFFVGHLNLEDAADALGTKFAYLSTILNGLHQPSRRTVLGNNWLEKLPKLHRNAAKGEPIPETELQALEAYLNNIVRCTPLTPFICHLDLKSVAPDLGISLTNLRAVLRGLHSPSRKTILKYDWRNRLPLLHPATQKGEAIPKKDLKDLEYYLDQIIGDFPVDFFLTLFRAEFAQKLGLTEDRLNQIRREEFSICKVEVGVRDWRNILIELNPGATRQQIKELDCYLLSLPTFHRYNRPVQQLNDKWRIAMGDTFTRMRREAGFESPADMVKTWSNRTVENRLSRNIYPSMEACSFEITKYPTPRKNRAAERRAYLGAALLLCKSIGISDETANKMAYGETVKLAIRSQAPAYLRLISLLPELTPAGRSAAA